MDIPNSVINLLKSDNCKKNIRVTFPEINHVDITNDNIISFSFTESLCSGNELKLGKNERSVINMEIYGVDNIKGQTIKVYCEIFCSSDVEGAIYDNNLGAYIYKIPLGVFVVDEAEREPSNLKVRQITAYTKMVEYTMLNSTKLNLLKLIADNKDYEFNPATLTTSYFIKPNQVNTPVPYNDILQAEQLVDTLVVEEGRAGDRLATLSVNIKPGWLLKEGEEYKAHVSLSIIEVQANQVYDVYIINESDNPACYLYFNEYTSRIYGLENYDEFSLDGCWDFETNWVKGARIKMKTTRNRVISFYFAPSQVDMYKYSKYTVIVTPNNAVCGSVKRSFDTYIYTRSIQQNPDKLFKYDYTKGVYDPISQTGDHYDNTADIIRYWMNMYINDVSPLGMQYINQTKWNNYINRINNVYNVLFNKAIASGEVFTGEMERFFTYVPTQMDIIENYDVGAAEAYSESTDNYTSVIKRVRFTTASGRKHLINGFNTDSGESDTEDDDPVWPNGTLVYGFNAYQYEVPDVFSEHVRFKCLSSKIRETFLNDNNSMYEILASWAELQAKNINIDRDGNLRLLEIDNDNSLYPATTLYPSTSLYPAEDIANYSSSNIEALWYEESAKQYGQLDCKVVLSSGDAKTLSVRNYTGNVETNVMFSQVPDAYLFKAYVNFDAFGDIKIYCPYSLANHTAVRIHYTIGNTPYFKYKTPADEVIIESCSDNAYIDYIEFEIRSSEYLMMPIMITQDIQHRDPSYDIYDMTDNFLLNKCIVSDKFISEFTSKVMDKISSIDYTKCTATLQGMPHIEPGKYLGLNAPNGSVKTLMLRRTLTGGMRLKDSI